VNSIRSGFSQFVPPELIDDVFEPEELALLLGGLSEIDVTDLESNAEYQGYTESNQVVLWFWEIVKAMSSEELKSLLQFVTGTYKVPVGGFAHLYGSNGPTKFTINKPKKSHGLPAAHSWYAYFCQIFKSRPQLTKACCSFNRLDLPEYVDKDQLKKNLLLAIKETQGFDIE
jgi:E3 ubiquitin-protein ligase NEDD4